MRVRGKRCVLSSADQAQTRAPEQGNHLTNHDKLPNFIGESSVGADSFRPQYRGLPRETNPQTDPRPHAYQAPDGE
jgi:hypothetical protein